MRKIKYRAFVDTSYFRGICEVTNISFKYDKILVEYLEPYKCKKNGICWDYQYKSVGKGLILLQYTGLNDKNGVEIYEGYIVKVYMDGEESIHQVKWFGDIGYPGFDLEPGWDSCGNNLQETQILGDIEIEVIGNIYEDSHLLERKNNDNN